MICKHAPIHTLTHAHIRTSARAHTHVHTHKHTHTHTRAHTRVRVHSHTADVSVHFWTTRTCFDRTLRLAPFQFYFEGQGDPLESREALVHGNTERTQISTRARSARDSSGPQGQCGYSGTPPPPSSPRMNHRPPACDSHTCQCDNIFINGNTGGLLKWIFAKDIESFSKLDTSKLRDAACCSCRGCCCSIPKSLQLCISARPGLRHRPRTRTPPLDGRRTAKRQKAHACWCPLPRQLTLRCCTCCFYGGRLSETPCSQPCPGVPHGAIKER